MAIIPKIDVQHFSPIGQQILLLSQGEDTWPLAYLQMKSQFGKDVRVELLFKVLANTEGMSFTMVENTITAHLSELEQDKIQDDILLFYNKEDRTYKERIAYHYSKPHVVSKTYVAILGQKIPISTGIADFVFAFGKDKRVLIRIEYDAHSVNRVVCKIMD